MQVSRALGLILTASVGLTALAGCQPAGGPTGTAVSAQKSQAAADAQTVAQVQRDLADMDLMADSEAGFATMVLGQPPAGPGMVSATGLGVTPIGAGGKRIVLNPNVRAAAKGLKADLKDRLLARRAALQAKAATRLKGSLDAYKKGMQKDVTDPNEFGGKTITITFDVTLPNGATRTGTAERAFNADKVLVSAVQDQEWKGPNGRVRTMERTVELQEDGSYKVNGKASDTFNGKTRTFTFEKTISAEGKVTGTGTMTRDGKTVDITFGGTEEKETTTVTDPTTNTTATAETSAETGTAGTVSVTEGGTTATVPVSTDAGTEPAASASPSEAAASPAASAPPSPAAV
jgi:hypothetical protein